jgi:hypothetical protein
MEQSENFWKTNMRVVPGRASPKKDPKKLTASTSSFEKYQKSVSDAWNLSEDELETSEQKSTARRPPQCAPKVHLKNQLPVVHKPTQTSHNISITANSESTQQSSSSRSQSFDTVTAPKTSSDIQQNQVHTSNPSNDKTGTGNSSIEYG